MGGTGGMGDTARGCGLAVIVLLAGLSIPGLFAVYKIAPCITGEMTTTTITRTAAGGETLTSTVPAPVCPEEGQAYTRAVGLSVIVVSLAVLVTSVAVGGIIAALGTNGLENVGLGWVAIWRGQTPLTASARDITPDSGRDAELHRLDVQIKEQTVQLTAIKAALGRQSLEDRQGWTQLPAGGAATTNGNSNGANGNGHKSGGADLSGFEVMG